VVDEEHEQAFKQQEGALYHARDMAVCGRASKAVRWCWPRRRRRWKASSTPPPDGMCIHVLARRHGVAELPTVKLIDLRQARDAFKSGALSRAGDATVKAQWLSPPLRAALEQTLAAGEQAMLFLNRRGYAP